MEDTLEFFRPDGAGSSATGRRRWPDDLKARIVAETFEPGMTVRRVADRHGVRASRVSEWRRLAKEGRLVLPAAEAGGFASLVLCDETASGSPPATTSAAGASSLEIAVGDVAIRVDADTPAERIAEIVRALGARA